MQNLWAAVYLAVATGGAAAQSSQVIYGDGLENNWQDWSWCTRDLTNPSPVHSGTTSISATCAAWEALRFHHAPFNASSYTNLVFWAHGGIFSFADTQAMNLPLRFYQVAQP